MTLDRESEHECVIGLVATTTMRCQEGGVPRRARREHLAGWQRT
jgi:hypothetical protein